KEYLKGFYALLDQAKEDPNPGFALRPIDLISELDLVLKNNYSYEYQFIGLFMYSVIKKDGTQQIKVFNDIKEPSNVDCQVIDIDDRPAIDVIIEFARDHTFYSRDLSARFNSALASLAFGNGDFYIKGQPFTYRNQLPKTQITREWQVPIENVQYKSPNIFGTSVGNATLIFDALLADFIYYKIL
ncbi:35031_t:CDS:2, partial [Gigaspora margarita]